MFNPQKLYKTGQAITYWQNARNLPKRAHFSQTRRNPCFDRWQQDSGLRVAQPGGEKKTQQRAQFCANRRNFAQPSAISKSVQFCFGQPPQPTLKRALFFLNERKFSQRAEIDQTRTFPNAQKFVFVWCSRYIYPMENQHFPAVNHQNVNFLWDPLESL